MCSKFATQMRWRRNCPFISETYIFLCFHGLGQTASNFVPYFLGVFLLPILYSYFVGVIPPPPNIHIHIPIGRGVVLDDLSHAYHPRIQHEVSVAVQQSHSNAGIAFHVVVVAG